MWALVVHSVSAAALPAATDVFVLPGERKATSVAVQNLSQDAITAQVALRYVSFDEGADSPVIGDLATDISWISLSTASLSIAPLESQAITVTVAPSEDVAEGSYVFALVSTEQISGDITFAHGTASLLFVTVGSISPAVTCRSFHQNDDGSFALTLQNDGQGILYDEGEVRLYGLFGIPFASAESNPSHHRVFAGQTRSWTSGAVTSPWWAVGPIMASFDTTSLVHPCASVVIGFGWLPLGLLVLGGCGGMWILRRR